MFARTPVSVHTHSCVCLEGQSGREHAPLLHPPCLQQRSYCSYPEVRGSGSSFAWSVTFLGHFCFWFKCLYRFCPTEHHMPSLVLITAGLASCSVLALCKASQGAAKCLVLLLPSALDWPNTPFYRWGNWVQDLNSGLPTPCTPTSAGDIWLQEEHVPSRGALDRLRAP